MLNKNRISRLLLACAMIATSGLVFGELREGHYGEMTVPNNYSGGVRANEGFFATFGYLFWQLPTPKRGVIGNPGVEGNPVYWNSERDSSVKSEAQWPNGDPNPDQARTGVGTAVKGNQLNNWNADTFGDNWASGQKYTFGFMNGHWGWDCEIFTLAGTSHVNGNGIQVGINDPEGTLTGTVLMPGVGDDPAYLYELTGTERLGVSFARASTYNKIKTWGVEFNLMRRSHATSIGMFELGLGVRYLKWNESFGFDGDYDYYIINNDDGSISHQRISWGVLDNSSWSAKGTNNLIGPQLGVRWFRQTGRFSLALSGKFLAAYNAQSVRLSGLLGSKTPNGDLIDNGADSLTDADHPVYQPQIPPYGLNVSSRKETYNEFTPMIEFGVNMNFQVTRKFSMQIGWTGIYAMDMLRPMGMVDYTISPNSVLGLYAVNHEDVFVHGFNFGLLFNR